MAGLLYWTLTTKCNLSCRYCFIAKDDESKKVSADKNLIINALPTLRKQFDKLILTGGEVLILPYLFDFIAEAKRLNFSVIIITNGVLLNKDNIEKLIRLKVDGISVSIDSFDEQLNDSLRGRSEIVKQNIKNLIELGYSTRKIKLLLTVTRKNIFSLPDIIDFCNDNKIGLNINPVEINNADNDYKEYDLRNCTDDELVDLKKYFNEWTKHKEARKQYAKAVFEILDGKKPKKISCSMGTNSFVIYPDGEAYTCFYQMERSLGNIYTDNITNIFQGAGINGNFLKADCVSLQCVCMTTTYQPAIQQRILNKVQDYFGKK